MPRASRGRGAGGRRDAGGMFGQPVRRRIAQCPAVADRQLPQFFCRFAAAADTGWSAAAGGRRKLPDRRNPRRGLDAAGGDEDRTGDRPGFALPALLHPDRPRMLDRRHGDADAGRRAGSRRRGAGRRTDPGRGAVALCGGARGRGAQDRHHQVQTVPRRRGAGHDQCRVHGYRGGPELPDALDGGARCLRRLCRLR